MQVPFKCWRVGTYTLDVLSEIVKWEIELWAMMSMMGNHFLSSPIFPIPSERESQGIEGNVRESEGMEE